VIADGLPTDFPPLRRVVRADAAPAARVVLADDSVLLREGIARLLEDAGFAVVAHARCEATLMSAVEESRPDVAIVDLRMPPTHSDEGLRAARKIREEYPGTGVLLLSQYAEPAYARELLADGESGVGYLLKDRVADVKQFAAAVRKVSEGGVALDPEIAPALA
jgi:DNA-binding NarL/FixJ family response regulator